MYAILTTVLFFVVAIILFSIGRKLHFRYHLSQRAEGSGFIAYFVLGTIALIVFLGMSISFPIDQSYKASYWPYRLSELNLTIAQTQNLLAPYEKIDDAIQGVTAIGEGVNLKIRLSNLYAERNYLMKYIDFVNSGHNHWWIMGHIKVTSSS